MPRLKANCLPKDELKALVLERKLALGVKSYQIANAMGISRQKLYEMLNKRASEEWTIADAKSICKVLRITADEMKGAIKCYTIGGSHL